MSITMTITITKSKSLWAITMGHTPQSHLAYCLVLLIIINHLNDNHNDNVNQNIKLNQ